MTEQVTATTPIIINQKKYDYAGELIIKKRFGGNVRISGPVDKVVIETRHPRFILHYRSLSVKTKIRQIFKKKTYAIIGGIDLLNNAIDMDQTSLAYRPKDLNIH